MSTRSDSPFHDILVVVAGLTPQIITETLYYLTRVRVPPVRIEEIFAISTVRGRECIDHTLLHPHGGRFHEFLRHFSIDEREILFDRDHVIVASGKKGEPLEDIKNEDDNEAMADAIMAFIREKTSDPRTALHCSVAGGRKTMSIFLAYALLLFGRPRDTLSHVLVTPEFESHPDFFYKPLENRRLEVHDRYGALTGHLDTDDATITLASIPYVRLRNRLRDLVDVSNLAYSQLVSHGQEEIDAFPHLDPLVIDLPARQVHIGEKSVRLNCMEIALYAFYGRHKKNSCRSPERLMCGNCAACFMRKDEIQQNSELLISDYERARGRAPLNSEYRKKLSISNLLPLHSKINEKIFRITGPGVKGYHIEGTPLYSRTSYGIRLEKKKITIID